jgi:aspartyl aminopeptidase
VEDLLSFIDASPTPWHAVRETARRLHDAGYKELDEREAWRLAPGERAFVVRGGGSIIALRLGARPSLGFVIVAAHTDSPGLRVKPRPEVAGKQLALGVEVYGGPLLHTWLDRDLSLAGRVALRGGRTALVHIPRIGRVPALAIHLDRVVNTEGLKLNPQTHLRPLLALDAELEPSAFQLRLSEAVAEQGEDPEGILAWDLALFDAQPSAVGGARNELVFAPRLDNLASCHAALTALLEAPARDETQVCVLYDHEEVGSESASGAASQFLLSVLERVSALDSTAPDATARALARSFLVSADMAHALHPNYAEKHDEQHAPLLAKGPVIKVNVSQRYATDGLSQAVFAEACQSVGVSHQRFVSRNDQPCGSTIGPITAARIGIRTVDVGNPMLSMHSARELCAAADVGPMIRVLTEYLGRASVPDPRA